jgi:hypothetical protein
MRADMARAIDQRTAELTAREAAFQKSLATLPEASRSAEAQALDRSRLDVRRFVEDAQTQFLGVQRDAENAFLTTLEPILLKISRTAAFTS